MTTTTFRWVGSPEGEHGTATYFPGMSHEVTVTMPTFAEAQKVHMCIEASLNHARWFARNGLLIEIGKIQP